MYQVPVGILLQVVIAVNKAYIVSLGQVQSRVPGTAETPIGLVDHLYPVILPGNGIAQGPGAIGGTVIDQQDF